MKHIAKILFLILWLPCLAYAVDSYPYDSTIQVPAEISTSGQASTETNADNNLSENNDPGSTYIGSVEVTVKTEEGVPIRSAKITATTSKNGNDALGICSTGSEGTCTLQLHAKSTTTKLDNGDTIKYFAEKNDQASTSLKLLEDSMQNGMNIILRGLTASEAADYQESTTTSSQNFQAPTTTGFTGGNSSVTIVPTRYTRVGSTNTNNTERSTTIGGVSFTLKVYYNSAEQTNNLQTQYQSSSQAFAYFAQNSLGSMFSGQQTRSFSGIIPDNGANSQLKISNLPAGNYLLTLEKSGFLSTNITFSLSSNENKSAFLVNMRPREGAEPPSLSQQNNIRKKVDENAYWAQIDGQEYLYRPEFPWYGWQLANQYIAQEPTYSTSTGYSPQVSIGSTTQGGYDTPWSMGSESLADYLETCQTMNFGQGVDAEDAAIAAAINGFGSWLFGNETQSVENFAETTLIPGLTTYFAAQAMEESGGSISISTGNANCFPTNTSPYYSGSSTNWYNYPNGYSTSNIPSECSRCLTTPPIVYDPNWCPSYCQNYANILGISPILSLLGSILD